MLDEQGKILGHIRYTTNGVPSWREASIADIADNGSNPQPDGAIDGGDFSLFISQFFDPTVQAGCDGSVVPCSPADITGNGGDGPPDGILDNGDFSRFLNSWVNDEERAAQPPVLGQLSSVSTRPHGALNGLDWRHGFAGYLYDTHLGVYHVRARTYDPRLGRWLQRDPIGYAGGWNLYEYTEGDPLTYIDPTGQFAQLAAGCAAGAAVGGLLDAASQLLFTGTVDWWDVADSAVEGCAYGSGLGLIASGVSKAISLVSKGAKRAEQAYKAVSHGTKAAQRLAQNAEKGLAYETRVGRVLGLEKNTGRWRPNGGSSGPYRVPDFVDKPGRTVYEAKDRLQWNLTKQLRDTLTMAESRSFTYTLVARPGAKFSKPLQRLIDGGRIKRIWMN